MYGKSSEKFKCSCNLYVIKVGNNLEITSSLDLGNKIWIRKPFIDSFSLQKPPSKFRVPSQAKK